MVANNNILALRMLVILTTMLILTQLLFLAIHCYVANIDGVIIFAIKQKMYITSDKVFAITQYIAAQLFLYALYIYVLWFTISSLADFMAPRRINTQLLAVGLWVISIIAILAANVYYVPFSFFTSLIRQNLLNNSLTTAQFKIIVNLSMSIWALVTGFAFVMMGVTFYKRQSTAKHFIALSLLVAMVFVYNLHNLSHLLTTSPVSLATEKKPNIFIIGLDAVRPDFLNYFNNKRHLTPHIDAFLKSSTVFTDTYTPLARTFPSWVGILTAKHPVHNNAREDMININSINVDKTLPQLLKQIGYETIYASDDNLFSNINNPIFGFDKLIGSSGNATDFILSAMNDFLISNLIIPTPFGKLLFPYNYANHGSAGTYNPDNFLELIDETLLHRGSKPLFFAAHFNTTAWPFYWFNNQQPNIQSIHTYERYKTSLNRSDQLFGNFLEVLKQYGLLEHAIFILVSDHGITLSMPNDRIVTESLNQDHVKNNYLLRSNYDVNIIFDKKDDLGNRDEQKTIFVDISKSQNPNKLLAKLNKVMSPFNPEFMGIDTSFGYGNDVLSLKQYRPLLAFKFYGIHSGAPHRVTGRSLLLDITPSLLDFLKIQPLRKISGISLMPYLSNVNVNLTNQRPIFIESNYHVEEIQQDNINTNIVLKQSISLFDENSKNGLISLSLPAIATIIANKQRAVLLNDWLLAYYPVSTHYKTVIDKQNARHLEAYTQPPYTVLVNLKTGKWTTNLNNRFAATAPLRSLKQQINEFYGSEMNYYKKSPHSR